MISTQPHFNSPCVIRIPLVQQYQTPAKEEASKQVVNTHIHSGDSTLEHTHQPLLVKASEQILPVQTAVFSGNKRAVL